MTIKRMSQKVGWLLFFLPFLAASTESVLLDADKATYNGKTMIFETDVSLDSPFGKVSADRVEVDCPFGGAKLQFEHLKMIGNVQLFLKTGGELSAGVAAFDCLQLLGVLSSLEGERLVTYSECRVDEQGKRVPFVMKAKEVRIHLLRPQKEAANFKEYLDNVLAEHDVWIHYGDDFLAESGSALYQRSETSEEIQLLDKEGSVCRLKSRFGELIDAPEIHLDILHRQLRFIDPKGVIERGETAGRIEFSSQELVWDEIGESLTLCGDVDVRHVAMGHLQTKDQVHIQLATQGGKKVVQEIRTEGNSLFTRASTKEISGWTISCSGKTVVDHLRSQLVFDRSPQMTEETDENQVHFKDTLGEIFADRACVNYTLRDKKLVPTSIKLIGNVRLMDKKSGQEEGVRHLALADTVEYFPETNEAKFTANPKKRVLFSDKSSQLEVSAPQLSVRRDQVTHKEQVSGKGDVRFSFQEGEFEQLRKKFQLKESSGGK